MHTTDLIPKFVAAGCVLAIFIFSSCGSRKSQQSESASAPMNVLFIALDDMNDWIHLLDDSAPIRTPNLERLAQKGVLFTQAYCASPSCNPSRTALLTGKMPSSTGVYNNATDWKTAMPGAVTLPRYFMQHGYRTEGAGKIFHHHLNGAFHDSTAFDEFQQMPWPPDAPMPKRKLNGLEDYGSPNTDWGAWPANDSSHVDARTVRYVTGKLAGTYDEPFFLAAGIFRPHMPFFVPEHFYEPYPADKVQMPVMKEGDLDDIPEGGMKLWEKTRWFFDGMMKAEEAKPGTWSEAVRSYQASAAFADAQVGKILDALEQSPYADNTIIVLWSDHGYHLGEKKHWEKFALWEKTTHVPFIVVAPGITTPGTRCEQPVSLIDIYPTLLELCGLEPRDDLDGESLVPLLKDPDAIREQPAVMTYGRGNHAVRKGKWRYIRYADGTEELYDRSVDPNEWDNLAGTSSVQTVMRELKQWLPQQEAPVASDMKKPRKKQ